MHTKAGIRQYFESYMAQIPDEDVILSWVMHIHHVPPHEVNQ